MTTIQCPMCGRSLKLGTAKVGARASCSGCGEKFAITEKMPQSLSPRELPVPQPPAGDGPASSSPANVPESTAGEPASGVRRQLLFLWISNGLLAVGMVVAIVLASTGRGGGSSPERTDSEAIRPDENGVVVVKALAIESKNGRRSLVLTSTRDGGVFGIQGAAGNNRVLITSDGITINDDGKSKRIEIGVLDNGAAAVWHYDRNGTRRVFSGTTKDGLAAVAVTDKNGKIRDLSAR